MIRLVVQHGVVRAHVPLPIRIPLKIALMDQRLLDLLHAFRLQVEPR